MAKNKKVFGIPELERFFANAGIIIDWKNVESIIKCDADESLVKKFKSDFLVEYDNLGRMAYMNNGIIGLKGFVGVFKKYFNIISFDDLVFQTTMQLEIDKSNFGNENHNGSTIQRIILPPNVTRDDCIEYSRSVLKTVDGIDVIVDTHGVQYITSDEYMQHDSIEDLRYHKFDDMETIRFNEFVNKVEEKIDFDEILGLVSLDDYLKICKYPKLGVAIKKYVLNKSKNIKPEDIVLTDPQGGEKYRLNDIAQVIKDSFTHIDLKKMILIANKRLLNLHDGDFSKYSEQEIEKLNLYTDWFEEVLTETEKNDKSSPYLKEMKKIRQKVDDFNNHIVLGKYHTNSELDSLSADIISGNFDATQLTKGDFVKKIKLSNFDLKNMFISAPNNFNYLVSLGIIDNSRLDSILKTIDKFSTAQVVQLFTNDTINSEKFLELFYKSDVNLDELKKLKENESKKKEIDQLLSDKELVSLYLDDDKREMFDKYRKLYKTIRLDDMTIDEQKENADNIIEQSDKLLKNDKMFELYHLGLVPIDTIVDYIGTPAVIDLYKSGELKHEDAQRMYDSKVLTKESILKLLKDTGMEEDEKLVLIYSTFPDAQYTLLRDELIDTVENVQMSYNSPHASTPRPIIGPSKSFNKYGMDPCARWRFLSQLDPDFSFEYLKKDGHMIVYLPNQGKYVIEKLFDKKKGMASKKEWAYGAATYVIDEDTFNMYKSDILVDSGNGVDKVVNRQKLIELNQNGFKSVKKIVHQGWGNAMCEEFNVEKSSSYTDEQRDEIKKLAIEAEQAKKILR